MSVKGRIVTDMIRFLPPRRCWDQRFRMETLRKKSGGGTMALPGGIYQSAYS